MLREGVFMFRAGSRGKFVLAGATLAALGVMGWKIADAAGFRDRLTGKTPQTQTKQGATPSSSGVAPAPPASRDPIAQEARLDIPAARIESAKATDPLQELVDRAIDHNHRRYLNVTPGAQQNSPWQIKHGILAYRGDLQLKLSQPGGVRKINAIEYISNEAVYRNEYWFEATPYGGRAHPFNVPYWFEGHVNQFLAILTMSNLPLNHEFKVAGGRVVTMADMVRHAQMTTSANVEPSWTLWFLTHYLDPDAEWKNMHGQKWSLAALAEIQTAASVVDAPCGGTHGLFALSYARNSYLQKHGDLRGIWLSAHQKIEQYIQQARNVQNQDGSFSTKFYRQREFSFDFAERIRASGHMLEWLMMGLPASRLQEPWVQAAVRSLATDLTSTSNQPIDPGPLYHASHALVLYRMRTRPRDMSPIPESPVPLPQTAERAPTSKPISLPMPVAAPVPSILPQPAAPQPPMPVVKDDPTPVPLVPPVPVIPLPVMPAPTPVPLPAPAAPVVRDIPKPMSEPVATVTPKPLEAPESDVPPPPPLPVLFNAGAPSVDDAPISVPVVPDEGVKEAAATVPQRDTTFQPSGPLLAPPSRLKLVPAETRPLLVPITPVPLQTTPSIIPVPDSIELPPQPPKVD